MKVGRTLGLRCSHFTRKEEKDFDTIFNPEEYFSFVSPILDTDKEYCEKCNDYSKIIRINAFVIDRDVPEFS